MDNENDVIKKICKDYSDYVDSEDFIADEMEHYENAIYETAMEFYFPGFFAKLNKKLT